MPINSDVSIAVTYDTSKVSIYINGELENYGSKIFNFKTDKILDIGAFSETNTEIFSGQIEYTQIYDYVLNPGQIEHLFKNGVAEIPKNHELSRRYTVDDRICISACTGNP